MDECCNTCKNYLSLRIYDCSRGGCEYSESDGFVCLVFADKGFAIQMVGINREKNSLCEGYIPKEFK